MASNSIGFSDATSVLTFVDDSTAGSSLSGGVARTVALDDVAGDAQAELACAGAAIASVEREVRHLWRDSMKAHDRRCQTGSLK